MSYSSIAMDYGSDFIEQDEPRHPSSPLTSRIVRDQFEAAGFRAVSAGNNKIEYRPSDGSLLVDVVRGEYDIKTGDVTVFASRGSQDIVCSSKSPLVALTEAEFKLTDTHLEGSGYRLWAVTSYVLRHPASHVAIGRKNLLQNN